MAVGDWLRIETAPWTYGILAIGTRRTGGCQIWGRHGSFFRAVDRIFTPPSYATPYLIRCDLLPICHGMCHVPYIFNFFSSLNTKTFHLKAAANPAGRRAARRGPCPGGLPPPPRPRAPAPLVSRPRRPRARAAWNPHENRARRGRRLRAPRTARPRARAPARAPASTRRSRVLCLPSDLLGLPGDCNLERLYLCGWSHRWRPFSALGTWTDPARCSVPRRLLATSWWPACPVGFFQGSHLYGLRPTLLYRCVRLRPLGVLLHRHSKPRPQCGASSKQEIVEDLIAVVVFYSSGTGQPLCIKQM